MDVTFIVYLDTMIMFLHNLFQLKDYIDKVLSNTDLYVKLNKYLFIVNNILFAKFVLRIKVIKIKDDRIFLIFNRLKLRFIRET